MAPLSYGGNTRRFGHVVLVTMENHSTSEVLGNPTMIVAWDESNLLDNTCSPGPTTILVPPDVTKAGAWTCGGHTCSSWSVRT